MQMFSINDLRTAVILTSDSSRFLIAEFIDDKNDILAMGFFTFINRMYELTGIPNGLVPSHDLNQYLWKMLDTEDRPPLAVPSGGYYFGDDYHTAKGSTEDITVLSGNMIEEIEASDGIRYSLVVSQQGCSKVAFIGTYAGTLNCNTPHECDLWRPTPIPRALLGSKDEMLSIYGTVDMLGATFMEFTDRIH